MIFIISTNNSVSGSTFLFHNSRPRFVHQSVKINKFTYKIIILSGYQTHTHHLTQWMSRWPSIKREKENNRKCAISFSTP